MKKAVITGAFDPITKGHEYLIRRAAEIFDEVVVAIGVNGEKKPMFGLEQRKKWICDAFEGCDKVKVLSYNGLTADFCKKNGIRFIVRGLRNTVDFEYESIMAETNRDLNPDVETVFFITPANLRHVSSTLVRDVINNKGDVSAFIPEKVKI